MKISSQVKGDYETLFKEIQANNNNASQSEVIRMLLDVYKASKSSKSNKISNNQLDNNEIKVKPIDKLNKVLDSILNYNVQQSKLENKLPEYLYISESLLCSQLGFNRGLAKRVFEFRQAEIDLQHSKFGIDQSVNMNYRDSSKRGVFDFYGKEKTKVMNVLIDAINNY